MIKINTKLAELVGAMMGDGCLSIVNSRSEKRKRKVALLTGHMEHDCDYYENTIRPIIQKEFKVNGHLKKREKYNCVNLVMGNSVFDYLVQLKLPVGEKKFLRIPKRIIRKKHLSKACVRGIFNTDGSIYRRYSKKYNNHCRVYDYLVIQFKLNSAEVIYQIKEILRKLKIKSNNIIKDSKCYVLRITDQKEIKKFMKVIKPSNKYHMERYLNKCKN